MRTFPARLFERLADTQPTRAGLRRVLGEVEVEPVFVLAIMGIGGRRPKLNVSTLAGSRRPGCCRRGVRSPVPLGCRRRCRCWGRPLGSGVAVCLDALG